MKHPILFLSFLLINLVVIAQSPDKISYQAVIRNNSNDLITNTQIGMRFSILQGSTSGTAIYAETQTPTTNASGLVCVEIGTGTSGDDFSEINWADGPYFIKTETDVNGGSNYTISGTSQLLSVPYAMYATTAGTITGGISETDPLWSSSPSYNITNSDMLNWNTAYSWGDHSAAGYLTTYSESDPLWSASPSYSITNTNKSNWNTAYAWGDHSTAGYLTAYSETDPLWSTSPAFSITNTNKTNWNTAYGWGNHATVGYLTSFTEVDGSVTNEIELPTSGTPGDMAYWDGTSWVTVTAGSEGQVLTFTSGVPTWTDVTPQTASVTNPTTGEIWMDRNLGASQVAIGSTDAAAYGDLYQWGRLADGHESRSSGTTSSLATSNTPGHGNFIITSGSSPYDWRSPQNDNLWQGLSGINNPCPSGYRLPTEAEWEAERLSWSSNNSAGAFNSPLKLTMGGWRDSNDGSLEVVDSYGYYWSSTVNGTNSKYLLFSSSNATMYSFYRSSGRSVRCIKD